MLKRGTEDQEARKALIAWVQANGDGGGVNVAKLAAEKQAEFAKLSGAVVAADRENTRWLGELVDKHGWPTHSQAGEDGAHTAWLLVQHADADVKFQRKCLGLMAKLPKEDVSRKDVAYLTDRVLLAEGKKQVYGTQFTPVCKKWEPRPPEDEANVDKRRAEAGLPPLAEYVKQLEAMYGTPKK